MKTPRDILLARHRDAEPALDAVRQQALAASSSSANAHDGERVSFAIQLWRELILPCRAVWVGLAAAWAIIFALHISTGAEPAAQMVKTTPLDAETVIVLREQRQILAQLLYTVPAPAVSRSFTPGPRGDVRRAVAMA